MRREWPRAISPLAEQCGGLPLGGLQGHQGGSVPHPVATSLGTSKGCLAGSQAVSQFDSGHAREQEQAACRLATEGVSDSFDDGAHEALLDRGEVLHVAPIEPRHVLPEPVPVEIGLDDGGEAVL